MIVNYPPLAISFSGGLGAVFPNQLSQGWMPPLARRQSPRCLCGSQLDAAGCTRSPQRSRCWMLVPSRAPPPRSHLSPGAGCRTRQQFTTLASPRGKVLCTWANTEPLRVLRGCVCWQNQPKVLDHHQQLLLCLGQIPKWVPSLLPCWLWPRSLENRLVQVGICFR